MRLNIQNNLINCKNKISNLIILMPSIKLYFIFLSYLLGTILFLFVVIRKDLSIDHPLRFWDMVATVIKWPNCFHTWGIDTFSTNTNAKLLQGECWGFNYGIFTMPLYGLLAWISPNAFFWVFVFSVLSFFLVMFIAPKTPISHLFALVILISPPVTLLFESGNPDVINIFLCLIAGIGLAKKRETIFLFCASIISLHKFYGIIMFIILLFETIRKKRLTISIFYLLAVLTVFMIIFYQIFFIGINSYIDAASNHYGISIWDNYLSKKSIMVDQKIIQLFGLTTLILGTYILSRTNKEHFKEDKKLDLARLTSIGFYLIFIFSYTVVNNVDYRLTFLCVALILDVKHVLNKAYLFRLYLVLILSSLYFTYSWGYKELVPGLPVQVFGDLTLHFVAMFCLTRVLYLLQQFKYDLNSKI